MSVIAEWIAPVATMIAAMMTAANLGARVTGWGFAVFVVGSVAWTIIGLSSGQTSLVAANAFLVLVNLVGVWRWLGREAGYRDAARDVAADSAAKPAPTLAPLADLIGSAVRDPDGERVGAIVDVLVQRRDGRIGALLVRHGGIGGVAERVVALSHDQFVLDANGVAARLSMREIGCLPEAHDAAQS